MYNIYTHKHTRVHTVKYRRLSSINIVIAKLSSISYVSLDLFCVWSYRNVKNIDSALRNVGLSPQKIRRRTHRSAESSPNTPQMESQRHLAHLIGKPSWSSFSSFRREFFARNYIVHSSRFSVGNFNQPIDQLASPRKRWSVKGKIAGRRHQFHSSATAFARCTWKRNKSNSDGDVPRGRQRNFRQRRLIIIPCHATWTERTARQREEGGGLVDRGDSVSLLPRDHAISPRDAAFLLTTSPPPFARLSAISNAPAEKSAISDALSDFRLFRSAASEKRDFANRVSPPFYLSCFPSQTRKSDACPRFVWRDVRARARIVFTLAFSSDEIANRYSIAHDAAGDTPETRRGNPLPKAAYSRIRLSKGRALSRSLRYFRQNACSRLHWS